MIFERSIDLLNYLCADQSKLRQVLINLLSNAIKFTETGKVTLRASVICDRTSPTVNREILHFEVEDTGTGIESHELEKLFKPFVQTKAGQKSHQGTGLGLSISQQFARLMNGEIALTSTPGQGTIFSFDVPFRREQRLFDNSQIAKAIKSSQCPTPTRNRRSPRFFVLDCWHFVVTI